MGTLMAGCDLGDDRRSNEYNQDQSNHAAHFCANGYLNITSLLTMEVDNLQNSPNVRLRSAVFASVSFLARQNGTA
jgi:hypothetical protein